MKADSPVSGQVLLLQGNASQSKSSSRPQTFSRTFLRGLQISTFISYVGVTDMSSLLSTSSFHPQGNLVIVMELGGGSLHSVLGQGIKWSDKDICAIAAQILSALGQIHAKRVIHRDVTLRNIIWFSGGIYKLCDFGISKQNVQPGEYARTLVGTPSYIPPELYMCGYATYRSDIYQLGLVLLSLMIGRHPIPPNSSPPQIQRMILDGVPRQLAELLIPTHGETARILSRMLPRHDAYRFQTAAEVEAAFTAEFWRLENMEQFARNFPLLHQQLIQG